MNFFFKKIKIANEIDFCFLSVGFRTLLTNLHLQNHLKNLKRNPVLMSTLHNRRPAHHNFTLQKPLWKRHANNRTRQSTEHCLVHQHRIHLHHQVYHQLKMKENCNICLFLDFLFFFWKFDLIFFLQMYLKQIKNSALQKQLLTLTDENNQLRKKMKL